MTDDRPRPKYGEYAPGPPAPIAPASPAYPPPIVAAIPAPRRVWDIFITTSLLLLGVFDVVTGFGQFATLADSLRTTYASQGFPAFTSDALANSMGAAINVARVAVLAVAIILSLLMIRASRRSFWVPLAGAVLSGLIVLVCVLVVILNDPALAEYVSTQTPTG